MRRLSAVLSVFAALVTLAACGGDGSTNPGSATVAGTYTLRTVNGSPLPYTLVQLGDDKFEVMADAITLKDGGIWTGAGTIRVTERGQMSTTAITSTGTYSLTGTAITITDVTGSTTGTVERGTLTVAQAGLLSVYTR
jgi:hypothetical protein